QIGEFSFLLTQIGFSAGALSQSNYSFVISATIISMVLTPIVSGFTAPLYQWWRKNSKREALETINLKEAKLSDHIVIAGGGRVGQHVARVLRQLDVPFVIIEAGHRNFEKCKAAKFPTIYGDASNQVVLEAAMIARAQQLLITVPAAIIAQSIVQHAHQLRPDLNIVVRADGEEQMRSLYDLGVYMVILPELEAGLEIARQALLHIDVPVHKIQEYTDTIRKELYQPIMESGEDLHEIWQLKNARELLELSWERLEADNPMVGHNLRQLDLRSKAGVSVVGVIRGATFVPNPDANFTFASGDYVAAIGNAAQRKLFKDLKNSTLGYGIS
ncbi:MAG: NAD-binding protein, partial [Desulfuromonadaceae bacterium]|nr:NAD-binding protein [Desulfuromonadaceae bacterium]